MKKLLTIFSLCLIFCTFLTLSSTAAEKGKITVSGTTTTLKRGDSLVLNVELNRNPGIKTLRCTLNFDPNVLEFVLAEGTNALSGFSYETASDHVLLRWNADKDQTGGGTVAKVSFRAKENAIYGDSTVSPSVSEAIYDAQNSRGDAIPFDLAAFKFTLGCPHENSKRTLEQEATFEKEGVIKETCPTCGNTTMHPLLPSVKSADDRVVVSLSAGEFTNDDVVEVRVENLYGTEEGKAALDTLGEDMFYCFRIRFTKNGEKYIPSRECTVQLKSESDFSSGLVLYAFVENGALQPKFELNKNTVEFTYNDIVFALVARTDAPEATVTPTGTTAAQTSSSPATTTVDLLEQERRKEITLIVIGVITLVLCGTGMILILGKRNRF